MYYIYGLIDPNTQKIKYIGKTCDPINRLKSHLSKASLKPPTYKNHWLKKLLRNKQVPIFKIIAKTTRYRIANTLEKRYIAKYKNLGYTLTNGTPGGDGWAKGFKMKITKKRLASYSTHRKQIIARNVETGKELVFKSVKDCADFLKSHATILSEGLTGRKGKVKSVKGYYIRYYGKPFEKPSYPYRIPYQIKRICIKNNDIKVYPSLKDVQKDGFSSKAVRAVCVKEKNRTKYLNYKWEYIK